MLHEPLFRLLAINLVTGAVLAIVLVSCLLLLNVQGLRDLILADQSPAMAIALLLLLLFITFGSAAIGTAVMGIGRKN